jgi:hypothetical protein
MGTIHAIMEASRRRVVPILITTTTTIGGLFSLAFGLGGKSLLWGPVASSIVWGLLFSTLLTLFAVPLLYLGFMRARRRRACRCGGACSRPRDPASQVCFSRASVARSVLGHHAHHAGCEEGGLLHEKWKRFS